MELKYIIEAIEEKFERMASDMRSKKWEVENLKSKLEAANKELEAKKAINTFETRCSE